METPARFTFAPDGSTKTFPVPALIKGDNYVRIDVDSVTINDRNRYDIVNNSVVFVDVADVPNGSQLDVLVVQTDEGITNLGAVISVDIVAQNIANVNTVATNIASVDIVAPNIASVTAAAADIVDIKAAPAAAAAAEQSEINAAGHELVAGTHATNASNSETAASNSETAAAASAAAALQSEIDAAGHELVAGTHATDAGNDRALAQTAKTEAEAAKTASEAARDASQTAKTASENAAINAVIAANSAEAAWDFFDDRYLGSKASAPTLDNDGDPLVVGAIYWNSTGSVLQIYNGSSWENIATLSSSPSFNSVSADDFLVDVQAGMVGGTPDQVDFITSNTIRMSVDSSGKIGIGTTSPSGFLEVRSSSIYTQLVLQHDGATAPFQIGEANTDDLAFSYNNTEYMRLRGSDGGLLIGTTNDTPAPSSVNGVSLKGDGNSSNISVTDNAALVVNRRSSDGSLVTFRQAGNIEGNISVSGTTVSYNGGHLARWSQLSDNTHIDILKGTVMTNLDQMAVWGNEDNEQLNCVAVSSVEGDPNVAGVFVNWDDDDEDYTNDMNIAMTGDMIIRIAQGTTVQRGDLLMSAGDGTAKPQGDDIVRSRTIAKVISTYVTYTYGDGSYCVPCVLMAC